jgi:hypothetical protein
VGWRTVELAPIDSGADLRHFSEPGTKSTITSNPIKTPRAHFDLVFNSSVLREFARGVPKNKVGRSAGPRATLSQSECDDEKFHHLTLPQVGNQGSRV